MPTTEPCTVQERECAAHTTAMFAQILFAFGRGEQIRTLEAIAASVANRVQASAGRERTGSALDDPGTARHRRFAHHLAALKAPVGSQPGAVEGHPAYVSCLRIARRAMAGAIHDPTGGATRFHPVDEAPDWARGMLPCATLGGFVFYRDDGSLLGLNPAADRPDEDGALPLHSETGC